MPLTVDWLDEKQSIALYRIEGYWAIVDLAKQLEAHTALGEEQPLYYIVDMSQSTLFPNGIFSRHKEYTQFFRLSEGMTVIVKAPRLAVIAVRILARFGVKAHTMEFADTIDEAVEAIKEHQLMHNEPLLEK